MRRGLLVLLALFVLGFGLGATQQAMIVPGGATLPATCVVRTIFFKTGSGAGLYSCNATNTWTGPLGEGGGGGGAPTDATYLTQTLNSTLSAEQALAALSTGILKSTTTTGVVSIAVAGTDYLSPTGSGAGLTNLPWGALTGVPAPVTALSGTNTGDQLLWSSILVSGQTTLTPTSTSTSLTVVAGTNVTLTTDNTAKTLTIEAPVAGSGAPTDAEYWVGTANGTLSQEKNLGALATALVLNTGGTPSAYTGIDCTNQFVRDVAASGAGTCNSVAIGTDVSGLGTGVATALGVNTGAAGAVVLFDGAGGTPSAITLTNGTNLSLATGVTGDLPFSNLTQASAASKLLGRGDSGAGDYQEISLGSGLSMSGTTLSASGSGKIAQVVTATFTSSATGSTQIPIDNTIPQNTEGDEYMTISITPTNASSTLMVQATAMVGFSTASRYIAMALFRDSGADAIGVTSQAGGVTNGTNAMALEIPVAAGSTSATTFKIRIGANNTGTVTFNGAAGGRLYGAIPTSTMSVIEVLP